MAGGAQEADDAITGINVTPLVDVVLVLLIIFMVTTKMIVSKSIPVDLPKAKVTQNDVQDVLSIVLAVDGSVQADQVRLANDDAILDIAKKRLEKNNEIRAVIRADSAVTHGRVIHVLDMLKDAHITKIAFGAQDIPRSSPRPAPSR